MELEIVFQLVSMPPSQRWLTKCWPDARAASAIGPCAWRLVPTYSTLPPAAEVDEMKSSARAKSGTVCDRSRMWMPLRAPKMYGFMRGFQRWVWWPKRSEEHTSELQSLMRISYAVFGLQKKKVSSEAQDR